ncbi:hypothetical protein ABR737_35545 [Streptomyces sp. Edi2]|uniref:hypothetical protein n=1 Tax=Streptomyces sp. Edi2 TaxID=3162528 RepID=UPI00330670E5
MSMTVLADSLLSYTIEPDPNPLTVSTAKDPVCGRLDITVGLGDSGPAYCKSVKVRIPIGAGDSSLTENRAQLTSAIVGASGWTARPGFADGTWQVFEFVPQRPVQVTGSAVTLVVSQIEVNKTVGEADIEIIEETSPTNGSFTSKTTEACVTKFPAEFVFRNFRPTKVMVCNGEKAVLKWDGSADAAYTMFWDRNSQDVSNVREWTTPQPLTAPTGFMLQATVTAGGQTLTHTLTTVVMVERPDLEVGHLDISGRTTFRGGPLEGLIQDRVFLHTRMPGNTEKTPSFRTQGPGIIRVELYIGTLPAGQIARAGVKLGNSQTTTVVLSGPAPYRASAVEPIKAGVTVDLDVYWPDQIFSGDAWWWWYPLGPQEPPVRI